MTDTRTEHTPGPWHVEDGALVKDVEPAGYFVCHPKTECDTTALCWTERKQDADLFAASPGMLAALEGLLPGKLCGEGWNLPDDETVSITVTFGNLRAARSAVAAARGAPIEIVKEYANV